MKHFLMLLLLLTSIVVAGCDETGGSVPLSEFVERNLAQLGSVPAEILIRGDRAYVINGFSDNIQVFDLNDGLPFEIGTIVVPPGSNPIGMDFVDDTFAYVANNSGQSVAKVNIQTRQCVTLIVGAGFVGNTQPCQSVITVAGNPFEEPSGVAVANNKVYISNNNLNEFFSPIGNGFITILNADTSQVIKSIPATGANSSSMVVDGNIIYLLNNGNVLFDFETSEFTCDTSFPPSIDTINIQTDVIINTLDIPLSEENPLVCLPNELTTTPDGRFGYMGLGLVGALLKVDLFTDTVVRGTDDPIFVTAPEDFNNTADIAIRGNQLFTTLFNSDQIAVVNTDNEQVNPFPYFAPFPAGIRAFDPNSILFDGVQSLAIRPGIPGLDFLGPDIFFITGISEQLGSVDSTLETE